MKRLHWFGKIALAVLAAWAGLARAVDLQSWVWVPTAALSTTTTATLDLVDKRIGRVSVQVNYTPVSTGTGVVKLQWSDDGVSYADVSGMTVSISAAGTTVWDLGVVNERYLRVVYTATLGAVTTGVVVNAYDRMAN